MAELTLYPSGVGTNLYASWTNPSNAYDSDDSSDTATVTYQQLASTEMYGALTFDLSELPKGIKISNIDWETRCSINSAYGKGSNGSWMDSGAKLVIDGQDVDTQSLSSRNNVTLLYGTVSDVSSLSTLGIKFFYTPNSYGAEDRAGVMTVYGAAVTITYTGGKTYKLTVTVDGGTITPSGTTDVSEKSDVKFVMESNDDKPLKSFKVNGVEKATTKDTFRGAKNAVTLLHLDENFTDSFGNSSPTGNGDFDTSNSYFGSGCYYLDGSSYITIPFTPTGTQYSWDFWVYVTSVNASGKYPTLFSTEAYSAGGGTYMYVDNGGYGTLPVCRVNSSTGTSNGKNGVTTITRNTWHHIEYDRDGDLHYFFIDGKFQTAITQSDPHEIENLYIGMLHGKSTYVRNTFLTGYVDEIMITNSCRHDDDFTPPTVPYNTNERTLYYYTLQNMSEDSTVSAVFGNAQTGYIKVSGSWKPFTVAYKKINGVWIEQTDLSTLFSPTTNYVKG